MAGTFALSSANHGGAVAWVVPTYKNARPVWRFCEQIVGSLGNRVTTNKTDRLIEFPSGGFLGVYTADNDVALRGEAFDLVIVDEAAQIGPETFSDVILPTLADRDGRCILISTPKGLNWFYLEYQAALGAGGGDRAAFTAPTSDNPMPTIRRAAEMARERVSERTYQQEWLAEFVADGAGVFRKVRDAATSTPLVAAEAGHAYAMGIDWGKYEDYTVITVLDVTERRQVYLERVNQIDYPRQLERVQAARAAFRPTLVVAEKNSIGDPLIDFLRQGGVPVWPWVATNASKHAAIEALTVAFDHGDLRILSDPIQMGELQAYQAERLPSGMLRYSAPQGMHDDTVMALAMAWQATIVPAYEPQPIRWGR